jgi:hypothetical protein
MQVVVASAGKDLDDAPALFVSWREGCRDCLGESNFKVDTEAKLDGLGLVIEMLSRATSVTGAAFEGQTLVGYHRLLRVLDRWFGEERVEG